MWEASSLFGMGQFTVQIAFSVPALGQENVFGAALVRIAGLWYIAIRLPLEADAVVCIIA
jgi:hypothetical protein